jgi:hypothetical protein
MVGRARAAYGRRMSPRGKNRRRRAVALIAGCAALLLGAVPAAASAATISLDSVVSTGATTVMGYSVAGATPGHVYEIQVRRYKSGCADLLGIYGGSPQFQADATGARSATTEVGSATAGDQMRLGLEDLNTNAFVLSDCKDVPEGPRVAFAAADYTVGENAGAVTLRILRTGGLGAEIKFALSLNLATKRNPAPFGDAGRDFASGPIDVTIPAGASSVDVPWPIVNDTVAEGPELFTVYMAGLYNGVQAEPSVAEVLINDDDPAAAPDGGSNGGGSGAGAPAIAATTSLGALKPIKARKKISITVTSGRATKVDVAIVQWIRKTSTCRYVKAIGSIGIAKRIKSLAACRVKGFVTAKLDAKTKLFTRTLPRGLPKGAYTVSSRAHSKDGSVEPTFTPSNQRTLRVT